MAEINVQAEPTYRQANTNDADAISAVIAQVVQEPNPVAFDRADGVSTSAAPAQVLAAEQVPGVGLVSISDYLCPRDRCAAVVGDVLILRQGSHVTNTYVLTLAGVLGERLARVISGEQLVGPTFVDEATIGKEAGSAE